MIPVSNPRHFSRARRLTGLLVVLMPLALAGGCATAPSTHSATHSCAELGAARKSAAQAQREAQMQQHDSWHAVIPVLVAGRYASAHSRAAAAERRVAEIDRELARNGCLHAAL